MTETVAVRRDDLRLLMQNAAAAPQTPESEPHLSEALARCGEAMDVPAETAPPFFGATATTPEPGLSGDAAAALEPPLPDGQFGRVELPGYRQHTGWITEETRFGVQMAVIRDWDGREMAAAVIGANSQVVYLPTPLKRPDSALALLAAAEKDDGFYEPDCDDEEPYE